MTQPAAKRRPDVLRYVLFGLVALAAVAVVVGALGKHRSADGKAAPDFVVRKADGTQVALKDLRGKVVMLNFWATWCPPCVEELPALVRLAHEFESQNLVFLALNEDDPAKADDDVRSFVHRFPEISPYVVFPTDDIANAYRVEALPMLFFIGPDGQLLDVVEGYSTEASARARIKKALATGSSAKAHAAEPEKAHAAEPEKALAAPQAPKG